MKLINHYVQQYLQIQPLEDTEHGGKWLNLIPSLNKHKEVYKNLRLTMFQARTTHNLHYIC